MNESMNELMIHYYYILKGSKLSHHTKSIYSSKIIAHVHAPLNLFVEFKEAKFLLSHQEEC